MSTLRKSSTVFLVIAAAVIVLFCGFEIYWETASPQSTCASCHEIESSTVKLIESSHRSMKCKECHGTAFSQGFHSLREKGMMLIHHLEGTREKDVALTEPQIAAIMDNCKRCHGKEYANWLSGGHSAPYSAIFLNEKHNKAVQPNDDCLRCHGMFYGGTIATLVTPVNTKGPWSIADPEQRAMPVIPCLACHRLHLKGDVSTRADYADPKGVFYQKHAEQSIAFLYNRNEKEHISAVDLPVLKLWEGERRVAVSDDCSQRVCVQCHAPNAFHQAGTSDDRTPRGVHEGLACTACHQPHSNDARESCELCHPAISNCGLNVATMNTTYHDQHSVHNIHTVACIDCHTKGIPKKK